MKKSNEKTEILEPEVEVMELETSINTALIKANITDQVIADLKERHKNVKLKSIDDKESYLECKSASKEIRKIEIAAEKICELGRSEAVKIQRLWISKQKELLVKTGSIKDPIDADIKKYEDEVERKENELKKKQEEAFINRQSALSKMGATYDNGSFVLNHISYELDLIKQADEEVFNDIILPKYRKEFEAKEAERVEEENKRKAEMELAKKQREEFEAQQAEFKKQQELFAQQQMELQKMKDDAEREKRLEQELKDAEDRRKNQEIIDNRASQLISLGMNYSLKDKYYYYKNRVIPVDILLVDDEKWQETFELASQNIAALKEIEEKDRKIVEAEKEQAAITKAIADAELKKQQDEQKKQEELAVAGDKEKYADVIKYLSATPIHTMKSSTYKGKMRVIQDFLNDLIG